MTQKDHILVRKEEASYLSIDARERRVDGDRDAEARYSTGISKAECLPVAVMCTNLCTQTPALRRQ
jgi:hypothetical protein